MMNGNGLETRKAQGKISSLEALVNAQPDSRHASASRTRAGRRTARRTSATRTRTSTARDDRGRAQRHHRELRARCGQMLEEQGHTFKSETDTEVLAHLIEAAFDGKLEDAVIDALEPRRGHVRHRRHLERRSGQDRLRAQGQPAADRPRRGRVLRRERRRRRFSQHTRQVVYLDDGEMARARRATATRSSTSNARRMLEGREPDRLGSRRDRARRLRPLHAQGDLRAAADDREHDARPPAAEEGIRQARRSQSDATTSCSRSTTSSSPPAARAGTRR